MFELGTLSLICIFLFMIHEFEEIIFVRPYISRHKNDKRFARELFVAGGDKTFPSTESIALLIGEEFVLACLILFAGIAAGSIEIVLAPFIAFTLHLIPHAIEAWRFPGWAPGSRTAVALLPPSVIIISAATVTQPVSPLLLIFWTVVIGLIFVVNLQFLHKVSHKVAARIK